MKSKKKLLISLMLLFSFCFAFIPSTEVEAAVKLNNKKVTLYVGKSTTLELKGTTEKAKWTSSNKKIATVSSKGKVKAKKKGTAKITAKVGKKKYTCKLTVKAKNNNSTENTDNTDNTIALQSISLNTASLNMKSGEQNTLTINYTPNNTTDNKTVQWSTSNPNCVSIDSTGRLNALQEGNATITATVGTKTASCIVYVTKTGILSNTTLSLEYPNTHKLSLTNANVVKWESGDPKIASVSNDGMITAVKAGTTTITCYDTYNNSYICNVSVSFPNINIKPIRTVYQTFTSNWYYMEICVTNNSNSQIKINQATMLYYAYSNSESMFVNNEDLEIVSSTNEIVIEPGKYTYIYGFEGKSPITLYSSGLLGLTIELNGVQYTVITDSTGKIVSMSVPAE